MKIITTDIAAARLGITPQRVRQLAKALALKPDSIGKALIWSESDLRKMAARKTSKGPLKGKRQ